MILLMGAWNEFMGDRCTKSEELNLNNYFRNWNIFHSGNLAPNFRLFGILKWFLISTILFGWRKNARFWKEDDEKTHFNSLRREQRHFWLIKNWIEILFYEQTRTYKKKFFKLKTLVREMFDSFEKLQRKKEYLNESD